jgi:serine/threonine kinase 32
MPEDLVKIYMAQLINSLEFMQSHNVIHRDLKPLNIMLDENFNLKLIDFGDAKVVEEKEVVEHQSTAKSSLD